MRYAVLGGGAAGLTLAWRLVQAGQSVTLFERLPLPGGLAAGFPVGDAWLERFYHHIFKTDRTIIRLIEELGLGDRLLWGTPKSQVLTGGAEHQLDSPTALLRFTPLSVSDRLRMAVALAYLKLERSPDRLEGQTAARWLQRWMGRGPYETVWRPLLKGKFGAMADQIAAPWFWARVHDRTTALGYVRGGFQLVYQRLAEGIAAAGGTLRFDTEVTGIGTAAGGGLFVAVGESRERFDRVISCLPTRVTCRLTPELPATYRERYDWGEAYGAHCLILALDRPLTGSYWLNINDPGYPFMVLVEHTNYLPAADYGGRHLVYLGTYRPMDDPIYTKNAETLTGEYLPHLARINRRIERSWIMDAWSFSAAYAQPIVTVDYRRHIPPARTPLPGLFLATMFQVYPHDRGQNYSIALAERLAHRLLRTPTSADVVIAR
ncbi:MAG: NAD(P)/FAD-dependent oxidoreductase [Chloroflexota bacterium]|nr:NAD(P)/FAD-dependent oxidoreductase [Chloroflexota bacterium]